MWAARWQLYVCVKIYTCMHVHTCISVLLTSQIHSPYMFTHKLTMHTAQIYLVGGKTLSASAGNASGDSRYMVTNHLFSMETNTPNKIPVWARLPDGPAGSVIFDFTMVAVTNSLWIHGGESSDGGTRPTLWSVQVFDHLDKDALGGDGDAAPLDPLWSVLGYQGMGARKRHCAAAIGEAIYFFGGETGAWPDPLALLCACVVWLLYVCASLPDWRSLSVPSRSIVIFIPRASVLPHTDQ
jgi:hypothetical protein